MPIKIMIYGDAGMRTGFERVFRGIGEHLHKTGHYDVIGVGLGYDGSPDCSYPFPVWPAMKRPGDYFGLDTFKAMCDKHKPDLIWCVQDVWNHLQYMVTKPIEIPYVGYFPVDTPNLKWSHANAFGAMSQPVAYTQFGAREAAAAVRHAVDIMAQGAVLKELSLDEPRQFVSLPHPETTDRLNLRLDYLAQWSNLENWPVIPHGLDRTLFYPIDRIAARKEFGIEEDAFIVGCINTNQFRKRHDTAMRMFAVLADKIPNARLLIYANGNNESGLDLHQAAAYLNIHEKCYFLHDQVQEISSEDLNVLYNCCDVMINTSGGEGWGLPAMEGAACGIPQLVPDWSATRELWQDSGILLPVLDWRQEVRHLNTCHAILDVKSGAQKLVELAESESVRETWGKKAKTLADIQPTWSEVGVMFERTFRRTLGVFGPPAKMSFNEVIQGRKGVVESELRGAWYLENGKPVKSEK